MESEIIPPMNRAILTGARAALPDPLLTVSEVAKMLRVSVPTIWRWRAIGRFPEPLKLGSFSRWQRSDVQAFIENAAEARTV